jgi:hypothetical protein
LLFTVTARGVPPPAGARSRAFLEIDEWDDWFKYSTLYALIYVDASDTRHDVGGVKIGQFGMKESQRRPEIPFEFEQLEDRFFSLGQDDGYYEKLTAIGPDVRELILRNLRDIAPDLVTVYNFIDEKSEAPSAKQAADNPRGLRKTQ